MNPMTNVKNIKKLSEQDIRLGGKSSWHDQYKDSAWIFVGGLPYDLTEGDIICLFSQYGEIVNINLVRDKETGKQKGYCFLCYEDQRSTILAVDNFNSIKVLGRTLRVDHVENYKAPKEGKNPVDEKTKQLRAEGCAPMSKIAQSALTEIEVPKPPDNIVGGVKLPPRLPIEIKVEKESSVEQSSRIKKEKRVKTKKSKKNAKDKKRKEKKKRRHSTSESSSSSSNGSESSEDEDDSRKRKHKQNK